MGKHSRIVCSNTILSKTLHTDLYQSGAKPDKSIATNIVIINNSVCKDESLPLTDSWPGDLIR